MRLIYCVFFISLTACSAGSDHAAAQRTSVPLGRTAAPVIPAPAQEGAAQAQAPDDSKVGAFNGVWEECDGDMSPDDCGRYVLIQRGDRICGTWSYVATADVYAGEVQATAVSATRARRTRICGRPGSATKTDCATGWETIDRPLRICDGKLSESPDSAARCMGRYVRSADPGTLVEALAAQPWVKACLTPGAQVAP